MNQDQIKECQRLLGSSKQDIIDVLQGVKTQEEADQRIEILKSQVRKRFRTQSKELHPDVTNDHEKIALFKRLVLVVEDFENLKVEIHKNNPPPPPRPVQVQRVVWVQTAATESWTYTNTGFPPGGVYRWPW